MLNIGDFVTRNSYNNDIVFKIIDIVGGIYYLKGISIRLCADSPLEDLKKVDSKEETLEQFDPVLSDYKNLNRNEYFYLPGKILHIDGDSEYLAKCLNFYKKNKLKAYGKYLNEKNFASNINSLLSQYTPDILVITGHDAFYKKRNNEYKNTSYFVDAVREARKYEKSHDKLLIIAGACQSNYEELIKAGSNFASSPKRINIHALDPAIVAACLAFSNKNDDIDLINILDRTKYGANGIGGIITKGTMYIGYPR